MRRFTRRQLVRKELDAIFAPLRRDVSLAEALLAVTRAKAMVYEWVVRCWMEENRHRFDSPEQP